MKEAAGCSSDPSGARIIAANRTKAKLGKSIMGIGGCSSEEMMSSHLFLCVALLR